MTGKSPVLVISLLLFLAKNSPSLCRILRLSCGSYANFSMRKSGFYLKGHVIREFPFLDLKYCYNHCLLDPLCKSVNVARGGNGLCQLNNASFYDPMDYVSLTKNNSWGYHSTNFSDRLLGQRCKSLGPCEENQLCMDTCECPGYECITCTRNTIRLHLNCDFDFGFCSWKTKWWERILLSENNDETTDTLSEQNNHCIRFDRSLSMVIGDKAVLEQSFSFNGDVCLSFFYYVDKEDFGSLRIHFDTELIWILPGNQTVDWLYGSVTIHGDSASKKIVIEGVRGHGDNGIIALDDVSIDDGPCPIVPTSAAPNNSNLSACLSCDKKGQCLGNITGYTCKWRNEGHSRFSGCEYFEFKHWESTSRQSSKCQENCTSIALDKLFRLVVKGNLLRCICSDSINKVQQFWHACGSKDDFYNDKTVQRQVPSINSRQCRSFCKSKKYKLAISCQDSICCN